MKRLIIVLGAMFLALGVAMSATAEEKQGAKNEGKITVSEKRYPPYPDAWDWVAPNLERVGVLSGHALHLLSNGDALYIYYEKAPRKVQKDEGGTGTGADQKIIGLMDKVQGKTSAEDVVSLQAAVFGGQTVVNAKSNVRILRGQQTGLELNDGTKVHLVRGVRYTGKNDRVELRLMEWGGIGLSAACEWPVRKAFILKDIKTGQFRTFVIFKLLDKPRIVNVEACHEYAAPQTLNVRTESLGGGILTLDDGTFLVEVEGGVLIRFDSDFHTKSGLINERYVILDFNNFMGTAGDTFLLIERLTGKKDYDLGKVQEAFDDLYNYLVNKRRK